MAVEMQTQTAILRLLAALAAKITGGDVRMPIYDSNGKWMQLLGRAGDAQWGDEPPPADIAKKPEKTDWKSWAIREQIIEDPASGLSIQFEVSPSGEPRLRLFGSSLPFGNREIQFDVEGSVSGTGCATSGLCKPAWLTELE